MAEGQYERIVCYFIATKYVDYKVHVLRGAAYRGAPSVGCRPRWSLASAKFEPTRDATRSRQPPSECAAGARTRGRTATVGFGFNFERPYSLTRSNAIQLALTNLLAFSGSYNMMRGDPEHIRAYTYLRSLEVRRVPFCEIAMYSERNWLALWYAPCGRTYYSPHNQRALTAHQANHIAALRHLLAPQNAVKPAQPLSTSHVAD